MTYMYVMDDYVRYEAELDVPRPESYREDLDTASNSSEWIGTQSITLFSIFS